MKTENNEILQRDWSDSGLKRKLFCFYIRTTTDGPSPKQTILDWDTALKLSLM